jgi:hypothetical protein
MENSYKDVEDNILNLGGIDNHDINLNPDFYIHLTYVKAINALSQENFKAGFLQFRVLTNFLESLAKASGRLPEEEYKEKLEKETGTEEQMVIKKIELLSRYLFSAKTLTDPLKDTD